MSTDRRTLWNTIRDIIRHALGRPRYHAAEQLADELTVTVRQAQHDAWTRGYAAAQLDAYDAKHGRSKERRSPYNGGRHAGTPKSAYARTNAGYMWIDDAPANYESALRSGFAHPNHDLLKNAPHRLPRRPADEFTMDNLNRWPEGALNLMEGTTNVFYPQTNPHPEGK